MSEATYRVAVFPAACICGRMPRAFELKPGITEFFVCGTRDCPNYNVPLRLPVVETREASAKVVKEVMDQVVLEANVRASSAERKLNDIRVEKSAQAGLDGIGQKVDRE